MTDNQKPKNFNQKEKKIFQKTVNTRWASKRNKTEQKKKKSRKKEKKQEELNIDRTACTIAPHLVI